MAYGTIKNCLVIIGALVLSFALTQAAVRLYPASNPLLRESDQAAGVVIGLGLAWRWRLSGAIVVLAVVTAWMLPELLAHTFFGIRAVQGGPTHVSGLVSAAMGVVLGAVVGRRKPRSETA